MSISITTGNRNPRLRRKLPACARAIAIRGCFIFLPTASALLLSSSCARQELTPAEAAIGKSFEAPKGKALICVYRPSRPFTGLIGRPVFINRQHVASTSSGSFIAVPVSPGKYNVQAAAQALFDTPEYRKAYPDITVNLTPGQSVFIRQTVGGSVPGSHSSDTMMLQTGGTPIPIPIGGGLPPFGARMVDRDTGRSQCSGLRQIASEPVGPLVGP